MKKRILFFILCCIALLNITGCGSNNAQSSNNDSNNDNFAIVPDIKIEDIDWKVGAGTLNGQNYVLLQYTNNSQYVINSFELKFTEKSSVSETEKDKFYDDIQASQGFDDEYFNEWKDTKKQLNESITMYGKSSDVLNPGETSEKIKCYYYGGWTSKNVLHSDLVTPEIAEIEYTKDNVEYILYYSFESESYDVEKK
ncbi:MAG: hypothetical protein IJY87_01645 [Bacilli bacterium]|nr:hypothetical protein [Bacilli bacterium]